MSKRKRQTSERRRSAVVIGASMAGLTAAAALASQFEQVLVLERDELPESAAHRRGVPQSKHAHGLQPGGVKALEDLFPGLVGELTDAGVPVGDLGADGSWTIGGSTLSRVELGLPGVGVTRPYLEHAVRTRVRALPNVELRDHVEVRGLLADDPTRVVGIDLANADGTTERLAADLVVDATGKVSKLPAWLSALGYEAPAEEAVHCKMAYLSRRWRLADSAAASELVTVITPAEQPHFGVMIRQEDGTHIVTLGGLLDSAPARTEDDYLDFAGALPLQRIADALVGATAVTELQPSHFPASRRRRYDKIAAFPAGLLAIGDAIASFNPMYGQGMTVAALEAVALRDMLVRGPLDARKFFGAAHRIEDVAWKISTGGDLRYDGVEGKRTPDMKLMNRYLDRLSRAARSDAVLARQFLRVAGFIDRPETFFRPSIVWRVIRGGSRAAAPQPSPAGSAAGSSGAQAPQINTAIASNPAATVIP
ncbi:MAG TPA: FAD-dependent monooxygenase [Jatrophihabitantaceae bacterium]